jgi:hypothetical protein
MNFTSGEIYYDVNQVREYLRLSNKDWSRFHTLLPWMIRDGKQCCGFLVLQEIKRRLDPECYLGEAQMILETNLYYYLFRQRVKELGIPSFKHPFNTRILYRTSDIPIIKEGRHEWNTRL